MDMLHFHSKPTKGAIKVYIIHMPPAGKADEKVLGRLIGLKLTLEAATRMIADNPGSAAVRIWADKD